MLKGWTLGTCFFIRPKCSVVFASISMLALAVSAADPAMVAKVKAGQVKEARVSWWGFNPEDSTKFVQDAINSGVPRLILDAMPNSWSVNPLKLVSNQEIVFENGAKLAARRGGFQSSGDILLTLSNVTNVTIRGNGGEVRMFRDDYAAAPYDIGRVGSRHAIYIRSSAKVTIEGLTIYQSGGDGINIDNHSGKYLRPCSDITIRNCKIEKSCRNGMAVGGVRGLTVDGVSISGTSGAWPKCGMSIVTETTGHRLENAVFRNCTIGNNAADAISIRLGGADGEKPAPVGLLFEKCTVTGNDHAVNYSGHGPAGKYAQGKITFTGCHFAGTRRAAAKFMRKPLKGPGFEFNDCVFENCSTSDKRIPDLKLVAGRDDDPPVDGLHFRNTEFRREEKFDWISRFDGNWMKEDVRDISGKIRFIVHNVKKEITLGSSWCHQNFPPKSRGETPKRFKFVPASAIVVDENPSASVPLSWLRTRSACNYIFYADSPKQVVFMARYIPISKSRSSKQIVVSDISSGKAVTSLYLPDFYENGRGDSRLAFQVPDAGFYTMRVEPGHNAFQLTESNVPVAFDFGGESKSFDGVESTVYLTPSGGRHFAVFINGHAGFELRKNDNAVALKHELPGENWSRYMAQSFGIKNLWSMKIGKPKDSWFGGFEMDMTGIHEHIFLSPKKYWYVK